MEENEQSKKIYMQLFKGIIDQVSEASEDVLLDGAQTLIDDASVAKYIGDKKIQPYLYLSGMLNLLGRDINAESISKVLSVLGLEPDKNIIDVLISANNENGVIYIYSIYFLVILGREPSAKSIMDLVSSLGTTPNAALAQKMLDFYNEKYSGK